MTIEVDRRAFFEEVESIAKPCSTLPERLVKRRVLTIVADMSRLPADQVSFRYDNTFKPFLHDSIPRDFSVRLDWADSLIETAARPVFFVLECIGEHGCCFEASPEGGLVIAGLIREMRFDTYVLPSWPYEWLYAYSHEGEAYGVLRTDNKMAPRVFRS